MRKLLYILALGLVVTACSEYQEALKTESAAEKYKLGTALFEEGKWSKANRLFIQIVPKYRGKAEAENLMYMYSKTFFEMRDYYTANYQFERFVSAYPSSDKVEEAAFLGAKSYYFLSPAYTKEQKETIEAIGKLQNFINGFPESSYVAEANELVKELDFKLEKKAFSIAKQYNKIGPFTRDYQASIKAFDNFLLNYPGTKLREEALFYRFDSAYKLAVNSVEWKMEDRLTRAKGYYDQFIKSYPESEFRKDSDNMAQDIDELLKQFNSKS